MNPTTSFDRDFYRGQSVLVTGAAGTVGRALIERLTTLSIRKLYALDNNETETFYFETHFRADKRVVAIYGDVRDFDRLHQIMADVDIVFHAAAMKHVTICERAPFDAVQTNILGVQNVINAALHSAVKRVIFMSSDKAVNPTNVMGTSKLMGERLITAANSMRHGDQAVFASTRFGNVIGSRGSVVELFQRQISQGGPVTLTDAAMTRFVMVPEQAVALVLQSAALARGGEVFVTKMPALRVRDLLDVTVETQAPGFGYKPEDIEIKVIGARPGEKLYEELLNEEETRRTLELKDHYVVLPAFRYIYGEISYDYPEVIRTKIDRIYRSDGERVMTHAEIAMLLSESGALIEGAAK